MWRMPIIHSSSPGAVNRPTSWTRRSWRASRLHRWRRQQTCHQPGSPVTSRVWVRSYLIINSKWLERMLPKNSEIVALINWAKLEAWPALEWISTCCLNYPSIPCFWGHWWLVEITKLRPNWYWILTRLQAGHFRLMKWWILARRLMGKRRFSKPRESASSMS